MTVKNFLELFDTHFTFVEINLYFNHNSEESISISADDLMASKYVNRKIICFDVVYSDYLNIRFSIMIR